jgi:hypothetical protein
MNDSHVASVTLGDSLGCCPHPQQRMMKEKKKGESRRHKKVRTEELGCGSAALGLCSTAIHSGLAHAKLARLGKPTTSPSREDTLMTGKDPDIAVTPFIC